MDCGDLETARRLYIVVIWKQRGGCGLWGFGNSGEAVECGDVETAGRL